MYDAKVFLLDKLFLKMKEQVTSSTDQWFRQGMVMYEALYGAFLGVVIAMVGVVFGYGYARVKKFMWRVKVGLKVLPVE